MSNISNKYLEVIKLRGVSPQIDINRYSELADTDNYARFNYFFIEFDSSNIRSFQTYVEEMATEVNTAQAIAEIIPSQEVKELAALTTLVGYSPQSASFCWDNYISTVDKTEKDSSSENLRSDLDLLNKANSKLLSEYALKPELRGYLVIRKHLQMILSAQTESLNNNESLKQPEFLLALADLTASKIFYTALEERFPGDYLVEELDKATNNLNNQINSMLLLIFEPVFKDKQKNTL